MPWVSQKPANGYGMITFNDTDVTEPKWGSAAGHHQKANSRGNRVLFEC